MQVNAREGTIKRGKTAFLGTFVAMAASLLLVIATTDIGANVPDLDSCPSVEEEKDGVFLKSLGHRTNGRTATSVPTASHVFLFSCFLQPATKHWEMQHIRVSIPTLIALLPGAVQLLTTAIAVWVRPENRGVFHRVSSFKAKTDESEIQGPTCLFWQKRKIPCETRNYVIASEECLLCFSTLAVFLLTREAAAAAVTFDLRSSIQAGNEPCFRYFPNEKLFLMNCTVLDWDDVGYSAQTHISLAQREVFDGKYNIIDLKNIGNFQGLFEILDEGIRSLNEAPVIRSVHVKNGRVAMGGGFIVRAEQKFLTMGSCSSTGDISGNAGGICGRHVGKDGGHVSISNAHSTGKIEGDDAGGIVGMSVGFKSGMVNITQSYSTETVKGGYAGGICGDNAGEDNGDIYITQSYSTGNVIGDYSGGITGHDTAINNGEVNIINCYTRGNIDGKEAGGISGGNTGGLAEKSIVSIKNTYASGVVVHGNKAGGIIGHISGGAGGDIQVGWSVFNGDTGAGIVGMGGSDKSVLQMIGNSGNLTDILGQLYHYERLQKWNGDIWALNGSDTLPVLRFQLSESTPTPRISPNPAKTSSRSATPTIWKGPSVTKRTLSPQRPGRLAKENK
eukprot:gb/GECG01008463.1/.p1 GENE.gb/GECG01008463.1/~~gb/GECG01008463.1/.p1  ORF type:complete len:618 (+),score=67.30 gb/GECG01008463.1/:1-1854(+)